MVTTTPPFSLTADRYDMTTYAGRCSFFAGVIDPRMAAITAAGVEAHRARLDAYARGDRTAGLSDAELWESRRIVDSCYHPPTQKVIPGIARMSAFIPVNLFIVPYMMLPSTVASVWRTAGIHIANQSYNAVVNYSNRSSADLPIERLIAASTLAVGVSASLALSATFGLRRLEKKQGGAAGGGTALAALAIRTVLPFAAVVLSSSMNVTAMRTAEWYSEGIDVVDDECKVRGKSIAAGRLALKDCCLARVLWNVPSMLAPPLIAAPLIAAVPWLRKRAIMFESSIVILGLVAGVIPALAVYPRQRVANVSQLEKEYQNLTDSRGQPIKQLIYTKGM